MQITEFIDDLLAGIIAEGYKVNTVYTSDMSDLSVSALNATRGYVTQMVYGMANALISAEDFKNYQQRMEFLSNISGDTIQLGSEQQEQIETVQEIGDGAASIKEKADEVVENAIEEVSNALPETQE
jgi:hypothetical protein